MITLEELLCKVKWEDIPKEHQDNLLILLDKINLIRKKFGKPMRPTNSYRTLDHHLRIYRDKANREKVPFDQSKVPMGSKHLQGCAVDIFDPKKELMNWLQANPSVLEEADLFCELGTTNWVHLQWKPFRSYKKGGTRWFKP